MNVAPATKIRGKFNWLQRTQISREFLRQRTTQPFDVNGCGDSLHPGRTACQRLNKQLSQQEYLDITRAQQSRERVMLLLCPRYPGQSVEE